MSEVKIVVMKRKQLLSVILFSLIAVIIIIVLAMLISRDKTDTLPENEQSMFTAGIYTEMITLGDTTLNLEVVVDKDNINSIRILNIDESIATMYPLVESSIVSLADQLCNGVPLESVTLSEDSTYTQKLLLNAITAALEKATE